MLGRRMTMTKRMAETRTAWNDTPGSDTSMKTRRGLRVALIVTAFCWISVQASAQTFNSGSTGADGELIINTPGVTNFTMLPIGGGNIYNFKKIQIAAGSTLKLSGAV